MKTNKSEINESIENLSQMLMVPYLPKKEYLKIYNKIKDLESQLRKA